ncbi:MAG: anti-sigma factor [Deltaproteobacteria bacterium]|nr:anti-sigma factor [Deltaproteobacteria bacterium]
MDPGEVQLAAKADAQDITVSRAGNGYKRIRLDGAPAKDLWAVMENAGGFRAHEAGLSYLIGSYSLCATNGSQAACHVYSRQVEEQGSYDVTLHGKRFASAASELFGALAYAAGQDPAAQQEVRSEHITCAKDAQRVWCGINAAAAQAKTTLRVSFAGLPALGDDFVYEGWLITDSGPVSAGRFSDPQRFNLEVDAATAQAATLYVLTIEKAVGDDPGPSDTHILAGAFSQGWATLNTGHAAALGSDFSQASGGFILATPTSVATDDDDQGIWFLDPAGPAASLTLPTLPAGWAYEGWVVVDGKPVSTGRFTAASGADVDGAGSAAGAGGFPPFPGQDFINPALGLVGGKAVVSVEPNPDDSPAPFALKPLVGDITNAGAGVFQGLINKAAASAITGVARLDDGSVVELAVVANRGEGTLSIIDTESSVQLAKVALPAAGEPMYATYDAARGRIFVGDRANDAVVVFDADDFSVVASIPSGQGVFHMWDSPDDNALWVVNDVEKSLALIDQQNLTRVATVAIPADLAAAGGKPHDVIVDPYGHAVYTTIVGVPGKSVVLKLSTRTGQELARADVGGDAHLSVNAEQELLYVPSQEAGVVHVLRRRNLSELQRIPLPGAHGAGMSPDGSTLYVTNLPAGGAMALYTIDLKSGVITGAPVSVQSDGKPHNLAVSASGDELVLTHSGPTARRVSVFSLTGAEPQLVANIDSGTNPFGLVAFTR